MEIWQNYCHCKIIFDDAGFFIFRQHRTTIKIEPIHTISYKFNGYMPCFFPSISFKPTFIDFALLFDMLSLSAVLIVHRVCVVCGLLFVCEFSVSIFVQVMFMYTSVLRVCKVYRCFPSTYLVKMLNAELNAELLN